MIAEDRIIIAGHGSGHPSTKGLASYNSSRYAQIASNGVRKGLVCVRRLKALTDEGRKRVHDKYAEIIGRNTYSQNLRQYVFTPYNGTYYSDCSSSICATFNQAGYKMELLNTVGMYYSDLFEDVPVVIAAGHVMQPELLRVGDILLYAGSDPQRAHVHQIGHVEMVYDIPEEMPVVPIEGTLHVNANELNVRCLPSLAGAVVGTKKHGDILTASAKCGQWFRISEGWVSRRYVSGWILEAYSKDEDRYWWTDNGSYAMSEIREINGHEYAFDHDGWMLTADRIAPTGSIIY